MKKYIISALFFILGLTSASAQTDYIYHYSVLNAMRNGVYLGDETISMLSQKGNFGLGTFNNLDGEMVVIDGVFYRIAPNGQVEKAEQTRKVPFASVTFFKASVNFAIKNVKSVEELQNAVLDKLPSTNKPYAIRIHAVFESITVGGANRVSDTDTTGLAELMKVRPQYNKHNISGTLVGFYNPAYMSGVDLSPFHLHFIADDKEFAGHVITGKFNLPSIDVNIDDKLGYQIVIPQNTERFNKHWLNKETSSGAY
jgi:acetolactate decarboxylase